MPRSASSNAATGDSVELRQRGEARAAPRRRCRGATSSRSARRGVPGQQPAGLVHGQLRAAELADLRALDPAAELEHHRLHAVADAEHRDPELEQLGRAAARPARRPTRGRRTGSGPSGCGGAPRRRRRGAAAARRTRRTRGRGGRSAASTGRRSRAPRPRRSRRSRSSASSSRGWSAGRAEPRPRDCRSACDNATRSRRARPCRSPARAGACLPSVCSAGATISSARLNSAMSW